VNLYKRDETGETVPYGSTFLQSRRLNIGDETIHSKMTSSSSTKAGIEKMTLIEVMTAAREKEGANTEVARTSLQVT